MLANTEASLFSEPSRRFGPRINNEQDLVVTLLASPSAYLTNNWFIAQFAVLADECNPFKWICKRHFAFTPETLCVDCFGL